MSEELHAVVSPTGMIHAVRRRSDATVCGHNYRRRRFAKGYINRYWTGMKTGFDDLNARREGSSICRNCLENLTAGTGR